MGSKYSIVKSEKTHFFNTHTLAENISIVSLHLAIKLTNLLQSVCAYDADFESIPSV